jgi:hypothetical protein
MIALSITWGDSGTQGWVLEDDYKEENGVIYGKSAIDDSDITVHIGSDENLRWKSKRPLTEKEVKEIARQKALQAGLDMGNGGNGPVVRG